MYVQMVHTFCFQEVVRERVLGIIARILANPALTE